MPFLFNLICSMFPANIGALSYFKQTMYSFISNWVDVMRNWNLQKWLPFISWLSELYFRNISPDDVQEHLSWWKMIDGGRKNMLNLYSRFYALNIRHNHQRATHFERIQRFADSETFYQVLSLSSWFFRGFPLHSVQLILEDIIMVVWCPMPFVA